MENVRAWLFWLRIPLALLGIVSFFAFYNRFLVDQNLQNLKGSLSIIDRATGVGQAEAALLLVDQTLATQMAQEELDLQAVVTLQYTQGVLGSPRKQRPVEDAQALLAVMQEERDAERTGVLRSLDGISAGVQGFFRGAALLPRQAFGRKGSSEIDSAALEEAARLEQRGLFQESARVYERLLSAYPDYSELVTLKLRLGSLYQRMQDFPRAKQLYQEASRQTRTPEELDLSRQRIRSVAQAQVRAARAVSLEKKLAGLPEGPERQEAVSEIATLYLGISHFNKAAELFREAAEAYPDEQRLLSFRFKEAWCLRSAGRTEEALKKFLELARREDKGSWAAAAYQQIAEIYKAAENLEGAASFYEKAIAQGDDLTAAVLHGQAGATYLYDLKNPEKAYLHFHELEVRYPASPFSTLLKQIQNLHQEKNPEGAPLTLLAGPAGAPTPETLPRAEASGVGALAEGSPLMGWMEKFLPVFVDVFTVRLSRYMEVAGEKELHRQFTQIEFQDLVVREVQRRFPGQVKGIQAEIHPNGFVGSGTVKLGLLSFPVRARLGIKVVEERPHVLLEEIQVAKVPLPRPILKLLESRINANIDQGDYPLKIKQYTLREGYAIISVELAS